MKLAFATQNLDIFTKQLDELNNDIETIVRTQVSTDFSFSTEDSKLEDSKFTSAVVKDYAELVAIAGGEPDYDFNNALPESMMELSKDEKGHSDYYGFCLIVEDVETGTFRLFSTNKKTYI